MALPFSRILESLIKSIAPLSAGNGPTCLMVAFSYFCHAEHKRDMRGMRADNNVIFREYMNATQLLSQPDQREQWHAQHLANDELCVENAIVIHRFNRWVEGVFSVSVFNRLHQIPFDD